MFNKTPLTLAIGLCLATAPISLFAEESEAEELRIVITGSHIKRIDQEDGSPLAIISEADIARTSATTLGELLQSTVYSNGSSLNNQQTGGFSVGASNYNLRGLRADRTLVLVDGKRLPGYPFAQDGNVAFTDLNIVPLSEIERIEILKDGASATYGSDAIAGVVNIITRRDYDSSEVKIKTSGVEDGDYRGNIISFIEGVSTKDTEVVFIGEFQHNKSLTGSFSEQTNSLDEDEVSSFSFPGTYFTLDQNSNLVGTPAPGCERTIDAVPFGADSGEACGFDWAPQRQVAPENHRIALSLKVTQDLGESTFLTDLSFNLIETDSDVPFGLVGGDFIIDATSPFNPIGETMIYRRGFSEIGLQNINTEARTIRGLFGFNGLISDFDYEVTLSHGRTDVDERFNHGWMHVSDRDELFLAIENGELDPFLPLTPAQIDQYTTNFSSDGESYQTQLAASISGEIMQLDAGSVFMATGLELRNEYVRSDSDQEILDGEVLGLGSAFAEGERDISALFAEFIVPFSKDFEVNLALRYDDYSDFGSEVNPKVSLRYAANEEMVFRASWGTGFRAPNLFELNSGDIIGTVGSIPVVSTGNADLEAETSESYNVGFVYDNNEQFSVSIDFWSIDVEDMITNLGLFTILTATNDQGDLVYEDLITLNPDNTIAFVTDPFINIDQQTTTGIDLSASWNITPELTWSINASQVNKIEQNNVALDEQTDLAGEYLFPKNRINSSINWRTGDFNQALSIYNLASHGTNDNQVDSYTKVDYQLNYHLEAHTFTFNIDNLLDEEPPSNRPSMWPYYEQRIYSPFGRKFSLQWKYVY